MKEALLAVSKEGFEQLSEFRYQMRRFERFSEHAAQGEGITPLQYLLLLHIKGYPDRDWADGGRTGCAPSDAATRRSCARDAMRGAGPSQKKAERNRSSPGRGAFAGSRRWNTRTARRTASGLVEIAGRHLPRPASRFLSPRLRTPSK